MIQVRVNIRALANVAAVRKETRHGRELLIVPSATLPDGIVMNDILYSADEIGKSFASLNRTPAPLGHPKINGQFVSASDPEGINGHYIGAWNENVRRENGRVFIDKAIDVEVAGRTDGGKALLAAIAAGEPINTSTGLLCELDATPGDGYKFVARNIYFDHDAILLNTAGAATPSQGVGMMVNGENIKIINSAIEDAQREMDWAGMRLLEATDRVEKASVWERMKAAIMGAIAAERATETAQKDAAMTVTNEQFEALSATVKTLSESVTKLDIPGMVANAIKPLTDNLAEMQANEVKRIDTEKADLVAKIVAANVLTESVAKELTVNALKELAAKAKPGAAMAMNGAFLGTQVANEFAAYDPNAAMEVK